MHAMLLANTAQPVMGQLKAQIFFLIFFYKYQGKEGLQQGSVLLHPVCFVPSTVHAPKPQTDPLQSVSPDMCMKPKRLRAIFSISLCKKKASRLRLVFPQALSNFGHCGTASPFTQPRTSPPRVFFTLQLQ